MESLFAVFTVLLALIIFAYVMNLVGLIFNEDLKQNLEIDKNLVIIRKYLKNRNLPENL